MLGPNNWLGTMKEKGWRRKLRAMLTRAEVRTDTQQKCACSLNVLRMVKKKTGKPERERILSKEEVCSAQGLSS